MPGPSAWFGLTLAAAVRDDLIDEAVVDEQVRHVLRLMERGVGRADAGSAGSAELDEDDPGRRTVARAVATEGTVLLVNDGLLPLDPGGVGSVAVIGPKRGPDGDGRGQLRGHAASTAVRGGRGRRTVARCDDLLRGGVPHRPGPAAHRHAVGGGTGTNARASGSSTSDSVDLRPGPVAGRPCLSRRVWPIGARHVDRPTAAGPGGRPSARRGPAGTFTPDVSGRWRLGLEERGTLGAAHRR